MVAPNEDHHRIPISNLLIFGLLTGWVYIALRMPGLLTEHFCESLRARREQFRERGTNDNILSRLNELTGEGFHLQPSRRVYFSIGYALAIGVAIFAYVQHVIFGPVESDLYVVVTVAIGSGIFFFTTLGFVLWIHLSVRRHEFREVEIDRLLAAGEDYRPSPPSAGLVARWEKRDLGTAMFLIALVPICAFPVYGAMSWRGGWSAVISPLLYFEATMLLGGILHVWGTRLLVNGFNDHLSYPVHQVKSGSPVPIASTRPRESADAAGEYDVFISYRREAGSETARLIRMGLASAGYRVFLDVDDLPSGHFDDRLLSLIEQTRNFVLILTPGALERASNEGDWVRREIEHAIKTGRNIVPVIMPGFDFSETASGPESLATLARHNAVAYSHNYFDAVMDRLKGYL